MDELRRYKKARTGAIIQAICDPILGMLLIFMAQEMQKDYRYYFESEYRSGASIFNIIGWILVICTGVELAMFVYYSRKVRELEYLEYSEYASSMDTASSALWRCPDCGQMISRSAVTCPHCGKPISPRLAQQRETWRCPNCGAENAESWDSCASCNRYRYQDELG